MINSEPLREPLGGDRGKVHMDIPVQSTYANGVPSHHPPGTTPGTRVDAIIISAPSVERTTPRKDEGSYMKMLRKLRGEDRKNTTGEPTLLQKMLAEAVGTGFIVLFGVGSVNASVFTGAQVGLWQVTVIWGFGLTLAILMTGAISGAHLNPAVTLAFALLRPDEFDPGLLPFYWLAQFLGAFLCGFINYAIYHSVIHRFEEVHGIIRGEPESVLSAMAFGEYFPNPGFHYAGTNPATLELMTGALAWNDDTVTPGGAMLVEAFGTGILMLVILSLTDSRNKVLMNKDMAPYFIGFAVAVLMSLYAPLTQGGFNPARDFGPRLAAACLGWGKIAIPGTQSGFWIYIIGPMIGAPLGAVFYDFLLRPPIYTSASVEKSLPE